MAPDSRSHSTTAGSRRPYFYLRTSAIIIAWIALIVYAHRFAHAYEAELVSLLASPFAKLAAATLFLTALVYFVCLSLPIVPNLGPRAMAAVFVWSALYVLGHSVSHEGFHEVQASLGSMRDQLGVPGLILVASIYALVLAVPFVPGVELGLLIIALFGTTGAVTAYLATIAGLSLAFAAGRLLPEHAIRALLDRVGIDRSRQRMDSATRSILSESSVGRSLSRRLGRLLLQHRHMTLALCLNFPGNSVAGGGGGLALLCGMSGQFGWRGFVLTIAVATLPLPLLVLAGIIDLQPLLQQQDHGFVHDFLTRIERLFIHH
jgi:hypothetical protein